MTALMIIIEKYFIFVNWYPPYPKWMKINVTSWVVELGGKMTLMSGAAEEGTSNRMLYNAIEREQRNKSLQRNVASHIACTN